MGIFPKRIGMMKILDAQRTRGKMLEVSSTKRQITKDRKANLVYLFNGESHGPKPLEIFWDLDYRNGHLLRRSF